MPRTLIWDLPTRLFHILLAVGVSAAAVIALLLGEHNPLFPYHALIGLTIALMVGLRILWGILGSRHARFSSFLFGPAAVLDYLKGTLLGTDKRHPGHNPGSAYAIFAMLGLVLALAATGFLMSRSGADNLKDVHEVLAYALIAVVALHILGVALHSLRHRENLTASMIHGRKLADPAAAITSSHPIVALAFLAISSTWAIGLYRNFDPATSSTTLPLLGTVLQLGENENEGAGEHQRGRDRHDD